MDANGAFQKALLRHAVTVLVIAFAFGGWIMRQQNEITFLREQERAHREEMREWYEWRNGTNVAPESGVAHRLSKIEGKITDLYRRVEQKP